MSHFDNKYYKTGEKTEKLVIFIHGYNGTPEAIDYAMQWLRTFLKNAVLVVPRAPQTCEKDAQNRQWLSFYQVDPEAKFRDPTVSTDGIFGIFDALASSFAEMAEKINIFIDEMQHKFGIDDAHTYVAGFSQGAMLTLYTALSRKQKLGGAIMVAGIVAGRPRLQNEIYSKPPLLVLHGQDDATVQFKTLPHTLSWLEEHGLKYECHTYPELAHRMNEAEMQTAANFINKNFPNNKE